MTHVEFENLTGLVINSQNYPMIEEMYMASGDMVTKGDFCRDYKEHRGSILLNAFYQSTISLKETLANNENSLMRIAKFLVHKSMVGGDQQMIEEAIVIMGEKEYLQYKIEKKLAFFTFDWDLTVKIINKR